MSQESVVAVYGLRPNGQGPVRLGAGSLIDPRLVLVGDSLQRRLESGDAPTALRVGIGFNDVQPSVEVIEVTAALRSVPLEQGRLWALELADESAAPLSPFDLGGALLGPAEDEDRSGQPEPAGQRRFFCSLWPTASFC
jgi:hypothetical protein